MSLKEKLKTTLRRPTDYVVGEWNRMAPRERRLVAILAGALGAVAILTTTFLIIDSLQEIAESNNETREALALIAKRRDDYLDAKSKMTEQERLIGTHPPQLLSEIEAAARETGVQTSDLSERPAQPAGKRYVEHVVDVTIRQVDLKSLANFLARLERNRTIMITQMNVRRGYSDGEKLNATLRATAFQRVTEDRTAKRRVGVAPRKP